MIVLSHEHIDHVGGFLSRKEKFKNFTVDYVWMGPLSQPGFLKTREARTMRRVLEQAKEFDNHNKSMNTTIAKSFESLILNNLGTTDAVEFVRALPQTTDRVRYLKRGDSVLDQPFSNNVQVEVLAPEHCVSLYYEDSDEDDYDLISDLDSVSKRLDSRFSKKNKTKHPIFSNGQYKNIRCAENPENISARDWRLLRKKNLNFGVQEMRALNCTVNNTSLVLLLTINGKTLLFPGDAEATSWYWMRYCPTCAASDQVNERCRQCKRINDALESVDFIKLSNHGSESGSPRETIDKLRKDAIVLVSTKANAYGTKGEIPSPVLLKDLKKKHRKKLITTQGDELWVDVNL